ncbi:MAG: DnaJ domain-containing protein [Pseudobdellovibrio sp.]
MLNQRSFSDILEDLILEEPTQGSNFTSGFESYLDPFGMAWLMGEINLPHYNSVIVKKAYPVKAKPIKLRPSHILNTNETLAYELLQKFAPNLKDNFNRHELKSAYRLAVLKTHPDQGGNSENFQDVKKSYQILEALVKN